MRGWERQQGLGGNHRFDRSICPFGISQGVTVMVESVFFANEVGMECVKAVGADNSSERVIDTGAVSVKHDLIV